MYIKSKVCLKLIYLLFCLSVSLNAQEDETESETTPSVETVAVSKTQEQIMTLDAMFKLIRETSPTVLFERERVRRALQEKIQERMQSLKEP